MRSITESLTLRFLILTGLAALLLGGADTAVAKRGYYVVPASRSAEFTLQGSGGYQVSVYASHGRVQLSARKGKLSASYSAPGKTTPERVEARLGSLGRVSVRFHPSGSPRQQRVPEGCKGKGEVVQRGAFAGKVEFEGEQGYTTLHASRARGTVTSVPKRTCKELGSGGGMSLDLTLLSADSGPEGIVVTAFRIASSAHPTIGSAVFGAAIFERQAHHLRITRSVSAAGGLDAFTTEKAGGEVVSAMLAPPSPFTGSATYQQTNGQHGTWTGTLAATFLGRGEVSLAGPQFTAEISH